MLAYRQGGGGGGGEHQDILVPTLPLKLLPTTLESMVASLAGCPPWVDSPLSAEKGLAAMLPIMSHAAVGVSHRTRHTCPPTRSREARG